MSHPFDRSLLVNHDRPSMQRTKPIPAILRIPAKWLIFLLAVIVVCFPYPHLLWRHLQHHRNPNALIDPHAPALQPLVEQLRPRLSGDLPPKKALHIVQQFVYEKIPYEWDWITWGMADYLPTVEEVIAAGREDCDGQALIAASLLRNFGFDAQLAGNFAHMWVVTDKGDTMGPGKNRLMVTSEEGTQWDLRGLFELPRALGFGIAVFLLPREIILVLVAWLLLLRRGTGWIMAIVALAMMIGGLLLLRHGGRDYDQPKVFVQLSGCVLLGGAIIGLFVRSCRIARRERTVQPHKADAEPSTL